VKLLFDENLSPRLAMQLATEFPGSAHTRDVGLRGADDGRVWEFAQGHGFAIVSKDSDFHHRSYLYGAPPKVVWLRVGNAGSAAIAALMVKRRAELEAFDSSSDTTAMVLTLERSSSAKA
jgi:predicted nuclease of predicted toxin-antitoxin system